MPGGDSVKKHNRSSSKARIVILVILLAVICVAGAELTASYFFAPELFETVTGPIRSGARSAVSLCKNAASDVAAFFEGLSQSDEPQTDEDSQLADAPLLEEDTVFADPSVTELKMLHGKEILTGGFLQIDYFNQGEAPWADQPYGSDDIGRYGCGPTVMAMVVSSMTDFETDPAQMAQWAVDNHHWASKHGSYLSIVEGASQAFGLTATSIEPTEDAIQTALLSGDLVVALMGPGHFTKGGHFIVLHGITLNGSILVADPNSRERSLMEWEPQLILDELSSSNANGAPLWVISKRTN